MIIDIHGDIWAHVTIKRGEGETNVIRNHHLNKFKEGNMVGGIFVIWADPPHDKEPGKRLKESILAMSSELRESRDIVKVIYNSDDFHKAVSEDKIGVMLGLEGLSGIGENIDALDVLYQLGFRHVGLTWNEENPLATGIGGDSQRGLTELGKKAVKRINELGMILDVSHANDKTFWDICEVSTSPIIASHSNSRSLCNVARNLTDEQIKAIGDKNGLIGLNAYKNFVHEDPKERTLDYLIKHLEHMVNLVGIDKIALGFDFFEYLSGDSPDSFTQENIVGAEGLEDISRASNLITQLRSKGFSQEDIDKIAYKNFLSLMDRILL